jgi:hypothetical protein
MWTLRCSGDIAFHTSLNSFFDSDFAYWPAVLGKAATLPIERGLPGHGEPGGKQSLDLQLQFLAALREAAIAGLAHGQTPGQIAAALHFPETLRPWVGPSLAKQLAQVCAPCRNPRQPAEKGGPESPGRSPHLSRSNLSG